jgi:hypothetical protein
MLLDAIKPPLRPRSIALTVTSLPRVTLMLFEATGVALPSSVRWAPRKD